MEKILNFEIDKETPGTFRYKQIVPDDEEASVPTIYIRKTFFEEKRPDTIKIIIDLPAKVEEGSV